MNRKNPAVKRIMADVKELAQHPSSRYSAAPLESNMFEWHFTIRGPADSPFEGGMYHGRILLPAEYPFKPPNIVFLTKNGRFEVGTKICLSISAYHEETWQPAWGVRTMLEAIISFFPSEGAGAIGALDWTKEERKKLANESRSFCCSTCGKIADLLSDPALDIKPEATTTESESGKVTTTVVDDSAEIAAQIAQLHLTKVERQSSDKVAGSGNGFLSDMSMLNLDGPTIENSMPGMAGMLTVPTNSDLDGDGIPDYLDDNTVMSPSMLAEKSTSHIEPVDDNAENISSFLVVPTSTVIAEGSAASSTVTSQKTHETASAVTSVSESGLYQSNESKVEATAPNDVNYETVVEGISLAVAEAATGNGASMLSASSISSSPIKSVISSGMPPSSGSTPTDSTNTTAAVSTTPAIDAVEVKRTLFEPSSPAVASSASGSELRQRKGVSKSAATVAVGAASSSSSSSVSPIITSSTVTDSSAVTSSIPAPASLVAAPVPPVVAPAVAVAPPVRVAPVAVVPPDAVDGYIDFLLRITGAAIMCLMYRLITRRYAGEWV